MAEKLHGDTPHTDDDWQVTLRQARAFFLHGDARPGIGLDFGPDIESFTNAVGVLGLDALIHDKKSGVGVHNIISTDSPGHTMYMARSAQLAKTLPLVETIKALQVANITRKDHSAVSYPLASSSRIVISHIIEGETDIRRPVAVLGSTWNNLPGFAQKNLETGEFEYYEEDELFSVSDELLSGKRTREKYTAIMEEAASNEYSLRVPEQRYFIKVGQATVHIMDIDTAIAAQWYDVPHL